MPVKSKFYNLDTDNTLSSNSDVYIPSQKATKTYIDNSLSNKQDTLVSGTNIKTINSTTILGSGNFNLADQSLSNLDSTGQMIVNSQNGTISNCILEIPQNIKVDITSNVLTAHAGTIITLTGSTYATTTLSVDRTINLTGYTYARSVVIMAANGGSFGIFDITKIGSGTTLPADGTDYTLFFKTDDKLIYRYSNSEWAVYNISYPLCIIDRDSGGNFSFAKDSDGNDMIFNGAGFIGHHAFVYPNVKGLIANEFNTDGSLKSILKTRDSLAIVNMADKTNGKNIAFTQSGCNSYRAYHEVEKYSDISVAGAFHLYYVKSTNTMYETLGSWQLSKLPCVRIVSYELDSNNVVTDFTIHQPVRLATTEMLDTLQDQINTGIDGKLDKVTDSFKVYATNSSGNQTTLGYDTGYSATSVAVRTSTGTLRIATPTGDSDATTKSYVDTGLSGKADDNSVVHKTGDETVAGTKTFSTTPVVGTLAEGNNSTSAASTAYVTRAITTEDGKVVHNTSAENVAGVKTFTDGITIPANSTLTATAGTVTVATQTKTDSSTKAASTAFVKNNLADYVPTTRKINDKALSSDITLTYSDVDALPSTTTINDLTTTAQQNALNSGITSSLVSQITTNKNDITTINGKIPSATSSTNQLADKDFVNSSISTNTATFDGSWDTYAAIPNTAQGFIDAGFEAPTNNNYLVVKEDETQDGGTWRYKYASDSSTYNKNNWKVEYEVNETPMTSAQLNALNSGITSSDVTQITTNKNAIGTLSSLSTTEKTNLVGAINELDTDKVEANASITGATKCKITYDSKGLVTAGANLAASDIPNLASSKTTAMTGYTKASASAAIGTSDSLNTAIGKLEYKADNAVVANSAITGATHTKITYDSKGLVTAGADLAASDIPSLTLSKISDVTATANELNVLDGITATTAELNYTDGVTSNIQTQLNAKAADNAVVKLTGNQSVDGVKTFTSGTIISKSAPGYALKATNITRATPPSSNQNSFMLVETDNNNKNVGGIYRTYNSDSGGSLSLLCYKPQTTDATYQQIKIGYDASGNTYTYSPTPSTSITSTSDTNIATTGWVNSRLNTVGGNYVTLNTTQTISGAKTFSSPVTIGSSTLTYNSTTQALEFSFA